MSSKESILSNIRKNISEVYDQPDLSIKGVQYVDTLEQFVEISKIVGAHVQFVKKEDDINKLSEHLYGIWNSVYNYAIENKIAITKVRNEYFEKYHGFTPLGFEI
mgnify:CR=1 FL=1